MGRTCPTCGAAMRGRKMRQRRFCTDACRMAWQENRFELARANPPEIKPSDDLDALCKGPTIVCPVIGCEWEGRSLGQHCNMVHGLHVDHLRELLGLCRSQSTATRDIGAFRSIVAKRTFRPEDRYDITLCNRTKKSVRAQTLERAKKARAVPEVRAKLRAAGNKSKEPERRKAIAKVLAQSKKRMTSMVCLECGTSAQVNILDVHRKKYCSLKCRNAYNRRRRKNTA